MREIPAPRFEASDDAHLVVLTFNVNYGLAGDARNIEAVRDADADIVLLQETTEAGAEAFAEALVDDYPHLSFEDCCNAGGLGYLSKHPILLDDYLEPPDIEGAWFPAWRVVVQTPLGPVQTLSVHLRPPVSDSGSWVSGQFTTPKIRAKEIEAFWALLDHDMPTIVAGDFNEGKNGRAVKFLEEQGMVSALPQVSRNAKTWHWPTKVGELTAMLDHVVYGPPLELVHAEVLDEGVSDHYPVRAVFKLAE